MPFREWVTHLMFFSAGMLALSLAALEPSEARDRAQQIMKDNDENGDGRISRDEWQRRPGGFRRLDGDGDGYLTLDELRARFGGPSPQGGRSDTGGTSSSPPGAGLDGQVSRDALDRETICAIGRGRSCDIQLAIKRGLFETGLRPVFPEHAKCLDIDEQWAIDYTYKREREAYHGGIDMPAPFGTPMIAVADGTVVGKYQGERSYRGMEIILRHSPQDTGLPVWIYTQYAHFDQLPDLKLGQRVRMGQVLGPTGNSGRQLERTGRRKRARRPAIHFAVWFSTSNQYVALRRAIIPLNGQWMDPNALFRLKPPFTSEAMKALPEAEKKVPISIMFSDGSVFPEGARIVWPYTCEHQ